MSATYRPGRVGSFADVQKELEKVRAALERAFPSLRWDILHTAPERVGAGDVVLADGADWDPGEGAGLYRRDDDNASWVAIEPTTVGLALAAHIADTTDAHDASAISILDTAGDFTATNVEDALAELQSDAEADAAALAAHLVDATDAHAASAITNTPAGTIAATTVQAAINELDGDITAHLADTVDAHDASAISFVPVGTIAATDAQTAIAEVATDAASALATHVAAADPHPGYLTTAEGDAAYQPLDADLTALAGASNGILTRTGAGTVASRVVTGTSNQISVANGSGVGGDPTLSLPNLIAVPVVIQVPTNGLKLADTDASHHLIINAGSNLTADRALSIVTGDAGRTLTIDASTTLGGGSHSGTNTGDQTSVTGNAGTVTVANEAADTTCFPLFATAASGSLEPKTNANMTFNASTGVITLASAVLTTADINGGTVDNAAIGATTASTGKFTTLETTSTAIVSANSATVALRVTQTGAGDALLIEDSANPDSTPVLVDGAGRFVNGHTAAITADGVTANQQQLGTAAISATHLIARFSANTAGSVLQLGKGRGATINAFDVITSGDTLGTVSFLGADSAALIPGASITAKSDGTPGTNDMPGRLELATTADAAASPTERFRLDNIGTIVRTQVAPANNNTSVTLTIANLKTGILTGTPAANINYTLPTGTLTDGGFVSLGNDMGFEWSVISLAAFTITILAGVTHTVVGNMVVAANSQGRFLSRKTAANTFVTYRIA